jgi:hypothetical protein
MLQRSLGLGTPELIGWDFDFTKTIGFFTKFRHYAFLLSFIGLFGYIVYESSSC